MANVSERRVCKTMAVPRSAVRPPRGRDRPLRDVDAVLAARVLTLIKLHPTYGYRRLWAILRFHQGIKVNKKAVYRVLKLKGWFVHQRTATPRPRVRGRRSRAENSNQRWAMDVTHIDCGKDGWAHLAAVIDCCDREIVGYELSLRARAKEAERALESACINRFGTLRPDGDTPIIRSDNGLIFQSRRFRAACKDYRLEQEFITPYCPQQNGIIERFFRSLKEECVWITTFANFANAKRAVRRWIHWYNQQRPHQALGYKSPVQFRDQKLNLVA